METSNLKNMVVLKNLPSNIVDEAIIVLKTNKKAKKLQKIEKNNKTTENEENKKDKEYILKEAEMLVNNYISKIENIVSKLIVNTNNIDKNSSQLLTKANLDSVFSLRSKIIEIKHIKSGEIVGYDGKYIASKDEIIGIVPIGYRDGIIRYNTGRYVYINDKRS